MTEQQETDLTGAIESAIATVVFRAIANGTRIGRDEAADLMVCAASNAALRMRADLPLVLAVAFVTACHKHGGDPHALVDTCIEVAASIDADEIAAGAQVLAGRTGA